MHGFLVASVSENIPNMKVVLLSYRRPVSLIQNIALAKKTKCSRTAGQKKIRLLKLTLSQHPDIDELKRVVLSKAPRFNRSVPILKLLR